MKCEATTKEGRERIEAEDAAKQEFWEKWQQAYGNRQETVNWKTAK